MMHDETLSANSDEVTVVTPDVYDAMLASLDQPTELSRALAEAAARKRKLVQEK